MADTREALLTAIYNRLNGNVGSGVQVFSSVPDNTPPPVVIIDQLRREDIGGKGTPCDRYSIEIVTVFKTKTRASFIATMAAVRSRIEGATLSFTGFTFWAPVFLDDEDSEIEDGVMIGRSRFQTVVQAA